MLARKKYTKEFKLDAVSLIDDYPKVMGLLVVLVAKVIAGIKPL
ncbi:hypothetical protein [Alteromonas sp. KUL106]|nr:hypothetical protein [Alteromonas sp. KUL106]GFD66744.1 hypothetical protein KUL106_00070 [Alteromonas sp. KUL106]